MVSIYVFPTSGFKLVSYRADWFGGIEVRSDLHSAGQLVAVVHPVPNIFF